MATAQQIQDGYIDYVLTNNEPPKSVYIFAKNIGITEPEFYMFYSSFIGVEKGSLDRANHKDNRRDRSAGSVGYLLGARKGAGFLLCLH